VGAGQEVTVVETGMVCSRMILRLDMAVVGVEGVILAKRMFTYLESMIPLWSQ
jgi:hypothetical protein